MVAITVALLALVELVAAVQAVEVEHQRQGVLTQAAVEEAVLTEQQEQQEVQVSSSYVIPLHTNTLHRHTLRLQEQETPLLS